MRFMNIQLQFEFFFFKTNDLKIFEDKKICMPLGDLCQKIEGTYSFLPPSNVKISGSWLTQTIIKTDSKLRVDLNVEMPAEYFNERDYLNYRYFIKRNIYLSHVYIQLVDMSKYANAKFEFVSDYSSSFKPLLLLEVESN